MSAVAFFVVPGPLVMEVVIDSANRAVRVSARFSQSGAYSLKKGKVLMSFRPRIVRAVLA